MTVSTTALAKPAAINRCSKDAGFDWHEGVVFVGSAPGWGVHAVAAEEDAAGLEHPAEFGQHPVLQRNGRHVVEHGEGSGGGEPPGFERHRCGVGLDNVDVRTGEARSELVGERFIEFDSGELWYALSEDIGCEARARADFEHVVTEVMFGEDPREHLFFHDAGPLGARTKDQVLRVHGGASVCGFAAAGYSREPAEQPGQDMSLASYRSMAADRLHYAL